MVIQKATSILSIFGVCFQLLTEPMIEYRPVGNIHQNFRPFLIGFKYERQGPNRASGYEPGRQY